MGPPGARGARCGSGTGPGAVGSGVLLGGQGRPAVHLHRLPDGPRKGDGAVARGLSGHPGLPLRAALALPGPGDRRRLDECGVGARELLCPRGRLRHRGRPVRRRRQGRHAGHAGLVEHRRRPERRGFPLRPDVRRPILDLRLACPEALAVGLHPGRHPEALPDQAARVRERPVRGEDREDHHHLGRPAQAGFHRLQRPGGRRRCSTSGSAGSSSRRP